MFALATILLRKFVSVKTSPNIAPNTSNTSFFVQAFLLQVKFAYVMTLYDIIKYMMYLVNHFSCSVFS